ncbi:MAG TPA: HAMP domain-containing sensor histidine kinase [Candidatus Eisenbacteria bacterium]|nr:HAMP domain-containing sensor histidine kinase [Candidatus Eisenbacteria bacterium]
MTAPESGGSAGAAPMTAAPGPRRSLFWTIAGMFFLTTVGGSLLQIFVAVGVLRPLETREARSRAELGAASAATEIAALPEPLTDAKVHVVLASARDRMDFRGSSIVYRGADGMYTSEPLTPPRFRAPGSDSLAFGGARGRDRDRGRPRFDVLAERPVRRGASVIGTVQVRRWQPRSGWGYWEMRTALLFVPFAVLASGLAGLVIVRLLVRRLRAIDALATRVAQGDLSVRIQDRSGDEIGRIAEQLDRMTERIAEARASLERNEKQRRQLFADITHELATPLTSIRGFAETLLDPAVGVSADERAKYTRGLLEEAARLDRLISDLFDLARLEAGASALHLERLDLAALAGHTVERYQKRCGDSGLRLEWEPPAGPAWIEADGRRMEQVLENLLNNAIRYVPRGGSVRVSVDPSGSRLGATHSLRVEDDGPGVPRGEMGQVFERFYRAESAGHGSDGKGSGLGLAIVKEIVERHQGTVRAEPIDPHGLSIVVELPPA